MQVLLYYVALSAHTRRRDHAEVTRPTAANCRRTVPRQAVGLRSP